MRSLAPGRSPSSGSAEGCALGIGTGVGDLGAFRCAMRRGRAVMMYRFRCGLTHAQDFVDGVRDAKVRIDGIPVGEHGRVPCDRGVSNLAPERQNDFLALCFAREETVEFALRPVLGKKVRAEDHDAKPSVREAVIDLCAEAIAEPEFGSVQPNT